MRKALLLFLLVIASAYTFLFYFGEGLLRVAAEKILNQTTREVFAGTIHLKKAFLTRGLNLRLEGIKGDLQTLHGPAPVVVRSVETKNSLVQLLLQKPLKLEFEGLKPASSVQEGLRGQAEVFAVKEWRFELRAVIAGLGLEDICWMNPGILKNATGKLAGELYFKNDYAAHTELELNSQIQEPGGGIQASLFETLTPYLPQGAERTEAQKIAQMQGLVAYRNAQLTAQLAGSDTLKVFLHILVPEYNLNLNLNIKIRLDKENAFLELADILGKAEVTI